MSCVIEVIYGNFGYIPRQLVIKSILPERNSELRHERWGFSDIRETECYTCISYVLT